MNPSLEVIGIGNVIVDIISFVSDDHLIQNKIPKGIMTPTSLEVSDLLLLSMPSPLKRAGGCVANTIAGLSFLGRKTGLYGKAKADMLGIFFKEDLERYGARYLMDLSVSWEDTGRCLIHVTPDGQRSMQTHLGSAETLTPLDLCEKTIGSAEILLLEGYLWDLEKPRATALHAADLAKKAGVKIAFASSDRKLIERHREHLLPFIQSRVDILFGDEQELSSLFRCASLSQTLGCLQDLGITSALTRGKFGSVIVKNKQTFFIEPVPCDKILDSTGAGDMYAAGFLDGLLKGLEAHEIGKHASALAAKILGQAGARPS